MASIQLDTTEQTVLIILSIALSITILVAIFLLFKRKHLLTSDQTENDDEFMIISNTDQMIAIKKSESASFEQLYKNSKSSSSSSFSYPQSPPPAYPVNK